mmetsp:Transcript_8306/g.23069  ORF Transcript_8306/g.23069 Transcript_8306/m.23069 type:complete len:212 (+) Transcript_8306:534-1169(+)
MLLRPCAQKNRDLCYLERHHIPPRCLQEAAQLFHFDWDLRSAQCPHRQNCAQTNWNDSPQHGLRFPHVSDQHPHDLQWALKLWASQTPGHVQFCRSCTCQKSPPLFVHRPCPPTPERRWDPSPPFCKVPMCMCCERPGCPCNCEPCHWALADLPTKGCPPSWGAEQSEAPYPPSASQRIHDHLEASLSWDPEGRDPDPFCPWHRLPKRTRL